MNYDWTNEHKVSQSVKSYFFRYDNYIKGQKNSHILKSTFGRKSREDIIREIEWWYNQCIGAYTEIEYT